MTTGAGAVLCAKAARDQRAPTCELPSFLSLPVTAALRWMHMPTLLLDRRVMRSVISARQPNEKPGTPRVVAPGLDVVAALDYGSARA